MNAEKRIYDALLDEHLAKHRQMAFVTGPRQVGNERVIKTWIEPLLTRVM